MNGTEVFYVTSRRGTRTELLLGPYSTGPDALADQDTAIRLACQADEFAWFDAYGVTAVTPAPGRALPKGKLNQPAAQAARRSEQPAERANPALPPAGQGSPGAGPEM